MEKVRRFYSKNHSTRTPELVM